jgi:hypothetical protein
MKEVCGTCAHARPISEKWKCYDTKDAPVCHCAEMVNPLTGTKGGEWAVLPLDRPCWNTPNTWKAKE